MTTDELRTHLARVASLAEEREDASNTAVEVERRLESLRNQQFDLTREINRILNNLAPILDRIPEGEAIEVNGYAFWADSEGPALCLLRGPHTLAPMLADIEREEQQGEFECDPHALGPISSEISREEQLTDDQIDDAALLQAIADVDRAFPDKHEAEWCPKCGKGIDQPTLYGRIHLDACRCPEAVRTASGSIHIRNGSEEP